MLHIASGDSWQTRTDADGQYQFDGLPAGEYRLQVRIRCCEYAPYQSEPVELGAAAERAFNIQLQQGFQLNTIGDDNGIATSQILRGRDIPDLPTPQMADGKPDLTGMWMYGGDPFPSAIEFTDWAAELVAARTKNHFVDSPRFHCLPTALPIPTHTPPTFGKFVVTPDVIVILYEGVLGFRQIFMDGRDHPDDIDPTWLGHSVGRWEDDVLVVDTIGFNDRGWTGLTHPRSEAFHVIERYRRTSYGDMELEITIEDPAVYKKPWAHHSFSAVFDADSPIEASGTVTRVDWRNPHAWIYIDVEGDENSVVNWGFEIGSPNGLKRSGWTRNTVKVGDLISVSGYRARDGSNRANLATITLADGREIAGNSSRRYD